jgi:hypothetical protein
MIFHAKSHLTLYSAPQEQNLGNLNDWEFSKMHGHTHYSVIYTQRTTLSLINEYGVCLVQIPWPLGRKFPARTWELNPVEQGNIPCL